LENDAQQLEEDFRPESPVVEVTKNGPLMVYGNISVKHLDGKHLSKNRVTALCCCTACNNKPICDGSYKKIDFKD